MNTGLDPLSARGNENTRSYCLASYPNIWGLESGDLLQATLLGPAADVEAAFAGDPAASTSDEVILAYPFIETIAIQRSAHVL